MSESKKINRKELKNRCESLINGSQNRRVKRFSGKFLRDILEKSGAYEKVPIFKGKKYRVTRGRGFYTVFKTYLNYLVEESLKYPIDIYIPNIGLLKIREIDSVGKKRLWKEGDKTVFRCDTPFDAKVMYQIYHDIFGATESHFSTQFFLRRVFVKPILRKVYKLHPNGGYYPKVNKKD